jgi:hypothetical protein
MRKVLSKIITNNCVVIKFDVLRKYSSTLEDVANNQ